MTVNNPHHDEETGERNPTYWFQQGYAAYVNPLEAVVPACWDLKAKAEFQRGYEAADRDLFSSGKDHE